MSDIFREVDEELQRKQMRRLWQRYGYLVIGAAVLIVALTAGYKGWQAYQSSVSGEQGDKFVAAVQLSNEGKHDEARTAFDALIKDGGAGYSLLARFRVASDLSAAGDTEGALAAFDDLSKDSGLDSFLRDVARIRAAYIAVDVEDFDAVNARVGDLAAAGNALRFSAREVLGLAAWKADNLKVSQAQFSSLREDTDTPAEVRQRAELMLALLKSRMEAGASAASEEKTETQ